MNEGTFLTLFFYQIFRFFSLESPFFGLTFGQILLGLFICELSIGIASDLFLSIFNTSSPGAQQKFKDEYHNSVWRERYKRYYGIK